MPNTERGPAFIDAEVFETILGPARAGKYHLVLGAGASFGCKNVAGELPMAPKLEEILLNAIGVEGADHPGLVRAFEAAVATLGESEVESLLRHRFADAEPLEWHRLIPRIPWEAIWTLNVDDVVERAYEQVSDRKQTPIIRLPRDEQVPFGGTHEEAPLIHLHGYVGSIGSRPQTELVFSIDQYLGAVRLADQPSWHSRFRGDYEIRPTIILGARLSEELDLASVIRSGNHADRFGCPSLIVRPGISDFDRKEYERWGLIAIDATAEEFFRYLVNAIEASSPTGPIGAYSSLYTDRNFLPLNLDPFGRPVGHDFYGGHAPEWADIVEGLDAVPSWLTGLIEELRDYDGGSDQQRLYLLQGPAFSGKSTALLRTALALRESGWWPILLVGRERIEWDSTLAYLGSRPRSVLLIDGLSLDASDVGELLRIAERQKQTLLIVAAERERHAPHIANSISPKHIIGLGSTVFVEPTNQLWLQIVEKRQQRARLGRLESVNERQRALHFVEHGRELYSALASLEDAHGFIDRGIEVYRELPLGIQTAFAAIGLLATFGLPAPIGAVSATSGVSINSLLTAIQQGGALAQWVIPDRSEMGSLRLRHRYLGDLLTTPYADQHHRTPMSEVAQTLCLSLADQMGPKTIRRKTLAHRVVAALMDLESVQNLSRSNDVDAWYGQMEHQYGWSARYWEQRSLGLPKALDRAYSYAKRAVKLHEDAFTLNTLGTVLMRRAVEESTGVGPGQRKSYWNEGIGELEKSRSRGAGRFEHPFVTFFWYTARLMTVEPNMDHEWTDQAEQEFRVWRHEAAQLGLFGSVRLRRLVEDFPAEWRR